MEPTAPVSLSPEQGTTPPPAPPPASPRAEEDPASGGGDDGFETASDPDAEDPAAPPEQTLPPSKPASAIAAGDENPLDDGERGNPDGVPIGNPDLEENSEGGVPCVEEKEPPVASVPAGSADHGVSSEENPIVDELVEAEPKNLVDGVEENGVLVSGDAKDENLGDGGGGSEEATSPAVEGVTALDPVAAPPDAVKVAAGAEKNDVPDAPDEKDEKSVEQAVVSEPVEVGSEAVGAAAGGGESDVPIAQDEKGANLGVWSEEVASSVVEGAADSKPLEEEPVAVESGKDEAADRSGSNQDLEGAAESKAVTVELEKDGKIGTAGSNQTLEEEVEPQPVEAESSTIDVDKAGADDGAGFNRSEEVNASSAEILKSESVESKVDAGGAENDEGLEGRSVTVGSENAEHSADKLDGGSGSEAAVGVGDAEKDEDSSGSYVSVDSELAKDSADKHDAVNDEGLEGRSVAVGSENAEHSADKLDGGSGSEEAVGVGNAEKDEDSSGGSVFVDSEIAKDFSDKHDSVNDGEAVDGIAHLHQDTGDVKVVLESNELISAQETESSPILAEESKSREAEPVQETAAASANDDEKVSLDEAEEEEEGSVSDGPARIAILESSETAKQIIKDMEEGSASASSHSGFRSSGENSHHMDGHIVSDSDEESDTDEEGEGRELFDSAALTALLKAATGASPDGGITITSQDAARIFSVDRPAGLGSSVPSLKPAPPRSSRPSPFTPSDLAVVGEPENSMDEEEKKLQEKVEQIRVKFLCLVQRLGHSPEDTVAAQVLYRLGLAEGIRRGRQISRLSSIENAKKKALQLEEEGKKDLDFSCNILVLGKTGVGKSATINSIFGEGKSHTNAFEPATTTVKEISGTVDGVKICVVDTPGLRASAMDQAANRKILLAIKKYTKRCPPDIVLYVDRMDTQTRDFNDLPLLRSITSIMGSSIWFNAIVALTHAASAPPDGPNGSPLSYEVFIAQRSHVVQHSIRQAAGDMRLMNPVALVENHPSCRRNREGERVLPNGLSWRSQLLLLCYSSKILSEANALLKLQDPSPGKLFGFRVRSPPLPYLLSSLLQSREHPKLSADQGGENGDSDIDLDDLSDTDQEEEDDEYDQLPPFKPLRKSQIAKLTKEQKRAYFDEYHYRVKLLQKKQWKEELRRLREMRKRGKSQQDDFAYGDTVEDFDQDGAPAAVPVPLPDMVLPPSFDCDNPVYRYRFLEPTSQLLIRPVLDSHGWDHDCGYDGVSIEENLAIAGRFPAGLAVQITKDKKELNIHLDSSISAKHGENGSSLAGFDIQSIGKQLAYILRSETKFKNLKKNKTAAGMSVTFLGETVATGLKVEDQLSIGKRVSLVASTGAVRAQGDVAYGANLEARLRDKDYPIGQALTTLGLSLMRWRSDLALGANLQSQFSIGRNSKMVVRVGLNNKLSGQITVRTSTSEQLQIALVGILPLAISFFRSILPGESYIVH